jgi:hypothetical protein
LPPFECPNCTVGRLAIKKENESWKTPHHEAQAYQELELDHIMGGRYHAFMVCQHANCGEVVSVIGDYVTEHLLLGRDRWDNPIVENDTNITPRAMMPAPHIIKVSPELSAVARNHLVRSFELFWVDIGSCANRIRIFLEAVLDQLGVIREKQRPDGTTYVLNLFQRVNELGAVKPGHEEALHALREVGNVGSHEGDAAIDDVLDCYELLEATLEELLENKKAKLAAKAAAIRARKGRPAP